MENEHRRWPWNDDRDEENEIEPYDETEDVRHRRHDWEDW